MSADDLPIVPLRCGGTIEVTLEYAGRTQLIPMDDPDAPPGSDAWWTAQEAAADADIAAGRYKDFATMEDLLADLSTPAAPAPATAPQADPDERDEESAQALLTCACSGAGAIRPRRSTPPYKPRSICWRRRWRWSRRRRKEQTMLSNLLWLLVLLLVLAWLGGLAVFHITTGLIHILIVLAVLVLVYNRISGQRRIP